MIDEFLQAIVRELGPQGLLIVGLYFLLYKPLRRMAASLKTINDELGEIVTLLKTGKGDKNG